MVVIRIMQMVVLLNNFKNCLLTFWQGLFKVVGIDECPL